MRVRVCVRACVCVCVCVYMCVLVCVCVFLCCFVVVVVVVVLERVGGGCLSDRMTLELHMGYYYTPMSHKTKQIPSSF